MKPKFYHVTVARCDCRRTMTVPASDRKEAAWLGQHMWETGLGTPLPSRISISVKLEKGKKKR